MITDVSADEEDDETATPIGVRFAESTVGGPIFRALVIIRGSFWLTLITIGAIAILGGRFIVSDGTISAMMGVYGISAVISGVLALTVIRILRFSQELERRNR